jgi:hypothetical protein
VVSLAGLDSLVGSVVSPFDRTIPRVVLGEGVRVGLSSERQCAHPPGQTSGTCERCASSGDACSSTSDCCNDSDLLCYDDELVLGTKSCRACRTPGQSAVVGADANGDGVEDGGCCDGLVLLDMPLAPAICAYCGGDDDRCAEHTDCCGTRVCHPSGFCQTIPH